MVKGTVGDHRLRVVVLGQQQFGFGIDRAIGIDEVNGIGSRQLLVCVVAIVLIQCVDRFLQSSDEIERHKIQ